MTRGAGSRVRRYGAACAVAALAVFVYPAAAQAQSSLVGRLGPWVNVGDQIRVTGANGDQVSGRLVGLTHDELVVRTSAGERRFGADARAVAVRRRPVRRAILVGAGAGAVVGVGACIGDDPTECIDRPMVVGALGAGVGAVYALIRARWQPVYPAPPGREAAAEAWQPGPLDDLGLRANLGDRVQVTDGTGLKTEGRLVRMNGTDLAVETALGEVSVPAARVDQVRVRRYPMRTGALIGAAALTIALVSSPNCRREDSDCQPLVALPMGAGVGAAIGALIPRMTPVFRAAQAQVVVVPVVRRGRYGLNARLQW